MPDKQGTDAVPRRPLRRVDIVVAGLALLVGAWLGAPRTATIEAPASAETSGGDVVRMALLDAHGASWRLVGERLCDPEGAGRLAAADLGYEAPPAPRSSLQMPGATSRVTAWRVPDPTSNSWLQLQISAWGVNQRQGPDATVVLGRGRRVVLVRRADRDASPGWTLADWRAAATRDVADGGVEADLGLAHVFALPDALPTLTSTARPGSILARLLAGDATAARDAYPAVKTNVPGYWVRVLAAATTDEMRIRAERRFMDGQPRSLNAELLDEAFALGEVDPSPELRAWMEATAWSRGWRAGLVRHSGALGMALVLDGLALALIALGVARAGREVRVAFCGFAVVAGLATVAVDAPVGNVDVAHDALGLAIAAAACWRLARDGAGRAGLPAAAAFAAGALLSCIPFLWAGVAAALATATGVVALVPLATALRPRTSPATRVLPLRPRTASRLTWVLALAGAAFVVLPAAVGGPLWVIQDQQGAAVLLAAVVAGITFALRLAARHPRPLPWVLAIVYPLALGLSQSPVAGPDLGEALTGIALFALVWSVAVLMETTLRVAGITGRGAPARPRLRDRLARRVRTA